MVTGKIGWQSWSWICCVMCWGCSPALPPIEEWVQTFALYDRRGQAFAVSTPLTAQPGSILDFTVKLLPHELPPAQLGGRRVYPADRWRLIASFKDSAGVSQPVEGNHFVSGREEVLPFSTYEVLAVLADSATIDRYPFGQPVWNSPPEPAVERGEQAYWGKLLTPATPGEYQLVIELCPTADPNGQGDLMNDVGPGIVLLSHPVQVAGERQSLPPQLSRLRFSSRLQDRTEQLAAMGIDALR